MSGSSSGSPNDSSSKKSAESLKNGKTQTTNTEDHDADQAAITLAKSMIGPLLLGLLAINTFLLSLGFATTAAIAYLTHPPVAPAFGAGATVLSILAALFGAVAVFIVRAVNAIE